MTLCLRILALLTTIFLLQHPALGQLTAPEAEAMYGGSILSITGIKTSSERSRIFVTTESANSAFFMDVTHGSGRPTFGKFQVVGALDTEAGFGSGIEQIDAHTTSGHLFFIHQGFLYHTDPTSDVVHSVDGSGVESLLIKGDHLFYVKGAELYHGTLDASGNFAAGTGAPLLLPPGVNRTILRIHPTNQKLYIFGQGTSPLLYISSDVYTRLQASTILKDHAPISLTGIVEWTAFGIAPDGRRLMAGSDFSQKIIAYADNDSVWRHHNLGFGVAPGKNLDFGGDASNYAVYYGNMHTNDKGLSGSWKAFGAMGHEAHLRGGPVYADPQNSEVVYLSTDMGIGVWDNRGQQIVEINEGIEAVQVNGMDIVAQKQIAWIASNSGVRKVSNYPNTPTWSAPHFPNGDNTPYYAVAMSGQDTQTVYACNLRVYKTEDGTHSWQRVFSAEDPPYNFPSTENLTTGAARIQAVKICPLDENIVMVGYEMEWGENGGLFYSLDGGMTWQQQLIQATATGYDVNVRDIVFTQEGMDTVAYIGVAYNHMVAGGHAIYRLVKHGTSWTVTQDMGSGGTSTGSAIIVSVTDISQSPSGDTLVACGINVQTNQPTVYFKDLKGANVWTPYTTSGFPFSLGKIAKSLTYGVDTVYAAVDEEIYYFSKGATSWTRGYTYPAGTQIQFLHDDVLLVGTETGLYGHQGKVAATAINPQPEVSLIQAVPNPVDVFPLEIRLPSPSQLPTEMRIYNAAGQMTAARRFGPGQVFLLDKYPFPVPGVYLIEVRNEGVETVLKVVVQE
ncbi:MAG: T9SS type A sorting domain-containing protein [Bacteroidota bacterium]